MTDQNIGQLKQKSETLYEKYGKPLEEKHKGEYLAVSPNGKTLLGKNLLEVVKKATESFGRGNFVYKVGSKSVGSMLWAD
jgi:hypothetical protein